MAFPVHAGDGVYILSDSSEIKGKQTAIVAEGRLGKVQTPKRPSYYKGPICPKCGDYRIRELAASREAAESREPTHRKAVGVKTLPALYVCGCGKRWQEG